MSNRLLEIVSNYHFEHIFSDYLVSFGDNHDGVIEFIGNTGNQEELFETGYYFGDVKPKPIINISPMIGCPAKCQFCELGQHPFVRCLSAEEMYEQVLMTLLFASRFVSIERQHKINVAKSGEPLLNQNLVQGLEMARTLEKLDI